MTTNNYFPEYLLSRPIWVLWKLEARKNASGEITTTKVPYNAQTLQRASSTDSNTWTAFERASNTLASHPSFNGLGIVLSKDLNLVFIDIDHCIQDGEFDERAQAILEHFQNPYMEFSQSGSGIHIFVRGSISRSFNNRKLGVEMYDTGRFAAMTGNALNACEPSEDSEAIRAVFEKYKTSDPVKLQTHSTTPVSVPCVWIVAKLMRNNRTCALYRGDWAGAGYTSQSEADIALCRQIAFWAERDTATIDEVFRSSGLMRDKWNREAYRTATITRACNSLAETYSDWRRRKRDESIRDFLQSW